MTEHELVGAAKNGDEAAFEELIVENWPKLQAIVHKHYRLQQADLDDIMQSASNKAWQKIGAFRGDSSFLTWLYTIVRNEAINYIKKRKLIDSHEIPASAHFNENYDGNPNREGDYEFLPIELDSKLTETAVSIMERQETLDTYRQIIEDTLSRLHPVHSNILRMLLEEGMSYKAIADKLNVPIGTVMSRLFFARKHAQKLIRQYAKQHDLSLDCVGA